MNDRERAALDARVAESEARTGAEIVLAVADRCDAYPDIPWKAFALGAAVAGLSASALELLSPGWTPGAAVLPAVGATLAAGAAFSLLTVLVPPLARLFLDGHRAEAEAQHYARSLFLSRGIASTRGRNGILLFIGVFERRIVALPDTGLSGRLGREALERIASRMAAVMARDGVARAFEEGLNVLEELLAPTKPAGPSGGNELPDRVVEEERP